MCDDDLVKLMKEYVDYDKIDWKGGRLSGTTFENTKSISELCAFIFPQFMLQNPLHADVHKGLRKIEAEILAQVLGLYNAPQTGCALLSGGGSESLGLAVLAARNRARSRGIRWPEVIMCRTAHSSIDKACHYFRIKLVKVDYDYSTWTANVKQMASKINRNTCLLIASAPDYPHGLIDDIQAISTLAQKHNIPCHVDACMGGFLLPFAEEAGFALPPFDFRLPGVTSISADIHKYGCSPKGKVVR